MPASIFSETELARLASFPEEIPGDDLIRANKGLSARALNEESITYREPTKESQSIGNLRFLDEILRVPFGDG